MGLRGKSIAIILSAFVCVCAVFLGTSARFYSYLLEQQGKDEALQAFNRVTALITEDLELLAMLTGDWGVWDDLYLYAEGYNSDFPKSNLNRETITALKLSNLVIYRKDGSCLFSGGSEPALNALLAPGTPLYRSAESQGIVKATVAIDGIIHLACLRTILHSNGEGPSAGILIMARPIGSEGISRWQRITGTIISEINQTSGSAPAFGSPTSFTRLQDRYSIVGTLPYGLTNDGTPTLHVAPGTPNTILETRLFGFFAILLTLLSVIIIGLSLFLFERLVLKRLGMMKADLEGIAKEGRPTLRVRIHGPPDELSQFASVLNQTLDALECSFLEIEENRKLLEHSLEEQEALFREVRHRVKNNLQLVVSLLNLQTDACKSPEAIAILEESKRRVLAMAFVHEELYLSPTMNRIDLSKYLERLLVTLQHSIDQNFRIRISANLAPIELSIEKAVPFGLIASEALAGALKVALAESGEEHPQINLELGEDGPLAAILTLKGCIGIGNQIEASNLGETLMEVLVAQLDGVRTQSLEGSHYTFSIHFPVLS